MLTRQQKESQVTELRDKFARATSVIVVDYRGVDVQSVNVLRGKLRGEEEAGSSSSAAATRGPQEPEPRRAAGSTTPPSSHR